MMIILMLSIARVILLLLGFQAFMVQGSVFTIRNVNASSSCSSVGAGTGTVDIFAGSCTYKFIASAGSSVLFWNLKISGIQNK